MPISQPNGGHFGLILPLCTSSATVGLALYQYPVFLSFMQAKPLAGKALSTWWKTHIFPASGLITAIATTSSIAGFISAKWLKTHATLETADVSMYYTYGAALALGHLAFWPLVAGPIKKSSDASKLAEEEAEKVNREQMTSWLMFHTLRSVVDLAALFCFAEGAALSFWII